MNLIENIKDVELIKTMPVGDKILAGLLVAFIGMTITFLLLMFIWGAIELLSKFTAVKKKEKVKPAVPVKETPKPVVPEQSLQDDFELVAVITAALNEYTKDSNTVIKIKNIKRVADASPAWLNKKTKKIWR